jgi:carboxyl-terminal processing protease
VRASDETVEVLVPRTVKKPVYDGPLVVLLDHGSASASELLSGALQDYGRAVVVGGEQSFGQGSVQMTIPMGEYLRGKNRRNVGGLALTIGKFYRVSGQSTQLLGVRPDLVLPSTYDVPTEGEASLIDPLSHDAIASVSELPSKRMVEEATLERLRAASERRVAASEEFLQIREERDKLRKEAQENRISLQESVRRKELEEAKQRYEARQQKMGGWAKGKRFYRLQLGDVKLKRLKGEDQDPLAGTDPEWMAVEEEGIRILEDLVWGARGAAH